MPIQLIIGIIVIGVLGLAAAPSEATETTLGPMPANLETQFALSALPPALRDKATVYLLDPKKGYQLSRQGTSGVACLVERTVWEWVDFRNDIYIPLCYDAVGTKAHLKVIMDTAARDEYASFYQDDRKYITFSTFYDEFVKPWNQRRAADGPSAPSGWHRGVSALEETQHLSKISTCEAHGKDYRHIPLADALSAEELFLFL